MRYRVAWSAALIGLFVAATAPSPAAAGFAERGCRAEIDRAISEAGVPAADVEEVLVIRRLGGDENSRIVGYDGWVRLRSCEGWLNVDLNRVCFVEQVYTRGDCTLPGVPKY